MKKNIEDILENIENTPAGFGVRAIAAVTDLAIFFIVSFFLISLIYHGDLSHIGVVMENYGKSDEYTYFYIISWFVLILIIIALWTDWGGKTPGKALFNIHIVKLDNSSIGFTRSIIRFLGYILSTIPLFIGFFMIFVTKNKRGLHDLVSGTKVVYTSKAKTYYQDRWFGWTSYKLKEKDDNES